MAQLDIIDYCEPEANTAEATAKKDQETKQPTEIAILDTAKLNAIELFGSPNSQTAIDSLFDEIAARARSEIYDVSTEAGRTRIGSIARQIGSVKQRLSEMADGLTEDWKLKTSAVNKTKKSMIEKFDSLRDEIRNPVIEYNRIMQERIDGHNKAIAEIDTLQEYASISYDVFSIDVALLKAESLFNDRDWQEFNGNAEYSFLKTKQALEAAKANRIRFDEEQAELARLAEVKRMKEIALIQAEAAEKARIAAEEKAAIEAKEAAAKAEREKAELESKQKAETERVARETSEREAALKAEQDRIQREKEQAEARAKKAEEDRVASELKAKADAEAAEKKRLADIEQARKDEEARQQRIKDDEAADLARREADKMHKAKIHNEIKCALQAVIDGGVNGEDPVKDFVIAIATGKIPHVKIIY